MNTEQLARLERIEATVRNIETIVRNIVRYLIRRREITLIELASLDDTLGYERTVASQKDRRNA